MTKIILPKVLHGNTEKCLRTLIYLFFLGGVFGIFMNLSTINNRDLPIFISENVIILRVILSLVTLLSLFLILKWQKWGVYLYGITVAVGLAISVLNLQFSLLGLVLSLGINFLLYWCLIKPLWKKFE